MQLNNHQIKNFQKKILTWYAENKRDLPWRKTRDPYCILISEVMSQQTQLNRVIPKYEAWIKILPTVFHLANTSTTEVLTLWSGLGYNRRALYLQKAAQEIVSKCNGIFPDDEKLLQTLPGIGDYTAKALLCFAFDKQIAVVDTNVRKVIVTQFQQRHCEEERRSNPVGLYKDLRDCHASLAMTNKDLQKIAQQLLPVGHAYEWNQALMDYAAAVLKKEKIPIPKQSKFKDSDRYYRGQIIKILIDKKQTTHTQLHDYFNKEEQIVTRERLTRVIDSLLKDMLIKREKEKFTLPQ